jgi:hypothetical protein
VVTTVDTGTSVVAGVAALVLGASVVATVAAVAVDVVVASVVGSVVTVVTGVSESSNTCAESAIERPGR